MAKVIKVATGGAVVRRSGPPADCLRANLGGKPMSWRLGAVVRPTAAINVQASLRTGQQLLDFHHTTPVVLEPCRTFHALSILGLARSWNGQCHLTSPGAVIFLYKWAVQAGWPASHLCAASACICCCCIIHLVIDYLAQEIYSSQPSCYQTASWG